MFPYRNGLAAYVWIMTPSGKRQRKYVYGRTREVVHNRWVELTRKAGRGPVVTKVPTVAQFLHRRLEDTVAPNLATLTCATYESHAKNHIEPGIGALRLDRLRVTDVQTWLNHEPKRTPLKFEEPGYWAAKRRAPAARTLSDRQLVPILERLHAANYGVTACWVALGWLLIVIHAGAR
jgi:hypothetical protein